MKESLLLSPILIAGFASCHKAVESFPGYCLFPPGKEVPVVVYTYYRLVNRNGHVDLCGFNEGGLRR